VPDAQLDAATDAARIAALEARLEASEAKHARLHQAYTRALEQLQLMRRRLFVAKAERTPAPEQLAFDAMFAEVKALEKALEAEERNADRDKDKRASRDEDASGRGASGSKGRRDLSAMDLPIERVEVLDPELEGKFERIGFEQHARLAWQRGGPRCVVIACAVYKTTPDATAADGDTSKDASDAPARIVTTPLPKELFRRCMLAPSMIAHVLCAKYLLGVPFYRLEQAFALQHIELDRGTMCRYAEDAGATLGAIVEAARAHAFAHAFCLSTDATGVSVQLGALADRKGPAPCRKGHYFVVLADRDHVFFEYQPKHTSAAVCAMFKGFSGYIQADGHTIYDALFEGRPPRGEPPDAECGPPPVEVGCWSHARTKFWEAAVCKHALGVEGLRRVAALFALDARLTDLAPAQRKVRRDQHVRPALDAFFVWARAEHARPRERGLVATAIGYVLNQEAALRRFLEDGRLRMENNSAERQLRSVAIGRKNWMFVGSDDHASAAGNLFSLIASCKLHGIDPESYLAEVMRVMPFWPRDRYLELAPLFWTRTRGRLDAEELARPAGAITVPPPQEQRAPS
jgi:hypothetical protein